MSERTLNVELLARVRDHILEEPRRYAQTSYGYRSNYSPCGTRACLAGWTDFLVNGIDPADVDTEEAGSIHDRARGALGLTTSDALILFSGDAESDWPEPFASAYMKAWREQDDAAKAGAAADYINFIIRTGKVTD